MNTAPQTLPRENQETQNWAAVSLPQPFVVAGVKRELSDVVTLELHPPKGALDFSFAPGQFNMLYVFGVGEVPISISGNPTETGALVHTVRAVGAVSRALCALKPGDAVGVRGPFGTPWPVAQAKGQDILIIGGGIGLAPLRPIMYQVLAQREAYGRVVFLAGARTPGDLLFDKELASWRGRWDVFVDATVDQGAPGWLGHVGVVTRLIGRARFDPAHTTAMICGPEVMIRFAAKELEGLGVARSDIYISMERNMKCGQGLCGHCQLGPHFVCQDGPVFDYQTIYPRLQVREL